MGTQTEVNSIGTALTGGLAHEFGNRFRKLDEILAIADLTALTCPRCCAVV
jgi:hypothetical protein